MEFGLSERDSLQALRGIGFGNLNHSSDNFLSRTQILRPARSYKFGASSLIPPTTTKVPWRGPGTLGLYLNGERKLLNVPAKRARCLGSHTDLLPLRTKEGLVKLVRRRRRRLG